MFCLITYNTLHLQLHVFLIKNLNKSNKIMVLEHNITLSALKFLCGENENVCRLCLGLTNDRDTSIEDYVTMDNTYYKETVTMLNIFEELGVSTDLTLPEKLCTSCVTTVTNTYLFQRLCTYSNNSWTEVLNQLSSSLEQTENLGPSVKATYLLINESSNVLFTSRKNHSTKSKKDVLANINKTVMNRYNYKKSKKKSSSTCFTCGKHFSSNLMLQRHNFRIHNKTRNACPQCPKIFASPMQLEDHAERVHYPKKLKCPKCDKMFSTHKMLNYHDKFNHIASICKLCFNQFPSKKVLRAHLDKHDVNNCPKCDKSFINKHTYKAHLKLCGNVEEKKPKFFCDICFKGYVRKNGIRSHLKTDHGFGNVLSCKWCGKKFDAKSKLKNHVVKHTKERNYHCEQCGNRFVTQAALVYHVRLHTGERPFPCELCDESFLSASRRMEHKRRKHFGPTKPCPVCPMKFVTSNQLQKHVQRHYNPHSKLYCPDTNESQQLALNTILVL